MPNIDLLILDIDNTLFDWFDYWYHSFEAMISAAIELTGIDRDTLLREIREVHQRHGTSEYAWLLQEVPSIAALSDPLRSRVVSAGRRAFSEARERTSHLYDKVEATLRSVKMRGSRIVGFTESQSFYTIQRLLRFGMDGVFDALYCSEEHETPPDIDINSIRSRPPDAYLLKETKVILIPQAIRKPDPAILLNIVKDFRTTPDQTLYVGDSKMKDIYMAQRAGVHDAYAEYGQSMNREGYELLRRVSHWTNEDIAREKQMAVEVTPTISLQSGFSEVLNYFDFHAPKPIKESAS